MAGKYGGKILQLSVTIGFNKLINHNLKQKNHEKKNDFRGYRRNCYSKWHRRIQHSQESKLNALTLANVEALSNDESGDSSSSGSSHMPCCPSPTYTGSWNSMVLDCSGCTYRPMYSGSTSSSC